MTFEDYKRARYQKENNYKVVNISQKKLCFIFCSSNGIYDKFDDNYEEYFKRDYYEWENISKSKTLIKHAGKYIFLRDPNTSFYIEGINERINNIDKIIDVLKRETKGYEIIIIGLSSGGGLAIILGNYLKNVRRVFSFGGIISLYSFTGAKNNYSYADTEIFKKYQNNSLYNKYFSLKKMLDNYNSELLYIYGTNSICDQIQIKELIGPTTSIFLLPIKSRRHGGDCYGFCYPYLFVSADKRIHRLTRICSKKSLDKKHFSIRVTGPFVFLKEVFKKLFFNSK